MSLVVLILKTIGDWYTIYSAPDDYVEELITLTFQPGNTSVDFPVTSVDDTISELVERFTVTLSDPQGASLGPDFTAEVEIEDNDG